MVARYVVRFFGFSGQTVPHCFAVICLCTCVNLNCIWTQSMVEATLLQHVYLEILPVFLTGKRFWCLYIIINNSRLPAVVNLLSSLLKPSSQQSFHIVNKFLVSFLFCKAAQYILSSFYWSSKYFISFQFVFPSII